MAIQVFEEVRLDPKISFGFTGGPRFKTTVVTNPGGYEQRNIDWSVFKHEFSCTFESKTQAELDIIRAFHIAMRGQAVGFRFFDHRDMCTDQAGIVAAIQSGASIIDPTTRIPSIPAAGVLTASIITASADMGDQTHQITKTYTVPTLAGDVYVRTLVKIASDAHFNGYINGSVDAAATVDEDTGIITFMDSVSATDEITADAIFDVPVRFRNDYMPETLVFFDSGGVQGVDLVEIRL